MTPIYGADVVLYAPSDELTDTAVEHRRGARMQEPRGRKSRRKIEYPAADLYAGFTSLLVKTALIRDEDFDPESLPSVTAPNDVAYLLRHLAHADQEHLVSVCISNDSRVWAIHETAIGTEQATMQTAANMLKVALLTGTRKLILAHNHPSGITRPSNDDLSMTQALIATSACAGVTLLDHIIIGVSGWCGLIENGRAVAGRLNRW